jgi:hypothetical protein
VSTIILGTPVEGRVNIKKGAEPMKSTYQPRFWSEIAARGEVPHWTSVELAELTQRMTSNPNALKVAAAEELARRVLAQAKIDEGEPLPQRRAV